jgi:hypothetical protein
MQLRQIARLDEWYGFDEGPVFITGLQALVRLLLAQAYRDRLAGLNTAGFVSGYRGSPLGGLDRELWRAQRHLEAAAIKFQPGLNEDLAATSIWGTQQTNLFPGARYDGVFAMWYGKGPGVDRSGDALKHGNAAGTSAHGGVLAVAGDDHTCKSSSLPHQSEYAFDDAGAEPRQRAGNRRARALWLRALALQRLLGRLEGHAGDGRRHADLHVAAREDRDRHAANRAAARWAEHSLAGSAERSRVSAPELQAARSARVRAREQAEPRRGLEPASALRHRDYR